MTNQPPTPDPTEDAEQTSETPNQTSDTDQTSDFAYQTSTELPPPPPMPPPSPALEGRLVRDPYTRLGGVASGIAHRYGFDVSIVRIAFILLTLASGFGILAYLLAWLIIPRADYWPPAGRARSSRSLSRRDMGLALAGIGILFALAFGGGGGTNVLIPLVLVGGGVWLLIQPSIEGDAEPAADGDVDRMVDDPPMGSPRPGSVAAGPVSTYSSTQPAGTPVPPRSRGRKGALVLVGLGAVFLIALPIVLIFGLIVAAFAFGDVDFDGDTRIRFEPLSAEELPATFDEENGKITIDLTNLDPDDFVSGAPGVIDARLDFGEIKVIVPEDLAVTVDSEVGLGDADVFDQNSDGFRLDVDERAADPDVELELDVGVGKVTVERVG